MLDVILTLQIVAKILNSEDPRNWGDHPDQMTVESKL